MRFYHLPLSPFVSLTTWWCIQSLVLTQSQLGRNPVFFIRDFHMINLYIYIYILKKNKFSEDIYIYIYIYICVCARARLCMCVYVCVCVCVCVLMFNVPFFNHLQGEVWVRFIIRNLFLNEKNENKKWENSLRSIITDVTSIGFFLN